MTTEQQIIKDANYWRNFEHDGWQLHGFTGKRSAQFTHKDDPLTILVLTADVLKFLRIE